MTPSPRERPPKLERSCPLPNTHTRLHQVRELWHRVAADYADPNAFVVSVNAALQALRSVSFMLKKERSRIPDFDAWYGPHEAGYRSDPLMRWLKDARNYVEKEGDLDLHSRARVNLLGVEPLPEMEFEVPPLLDEEEIASVIGPRLPERVRQVAVLAVERRWVSADMPDHELLDVLAYGYGKVAEVVADAHRQCGVLMQSFGDEAHERRPARRTHLGGRLSCMLANATLRTAHLHLGRNVLVKVGGRTREITAEAIEKPPFDIPEDLFRHTKGEDLLETAARFAHFARLVTKAQGYHLPMAMVFETREDAPIIHALQADDYQEQLMMMTAVAEEVERLHAEGVIFFGEVESEGEDERESELLVAVATDDGSRRQWRNRILKLTDGSVELGKTQVDDGIVPDFFSPVQRTWVRLGKGTAASSTNSEETGPA